MQNANSTINVNVGPPAFLVPNQTGCVAQVLWFALVGWWVGAIAIVLAYLLLIPVITIPLGIAILNKVPYLIALRQPARVLTPYGAIPVPQHNFFLRALWFLFFGVWLTALWLAVAYPVALTVIGLPLAFWMFDKVPAVLTLRRTSF